MGFFGFEEVAVSHCDSSPEAPQTLGRLCCTPPPATFNSVCLHSEFWFSRDPDSFTDAEKRLCELGPAESTRPRKAVLAVWGLGRGREAAGLGRPADQQCD